MSQSTVRIIQSTEREKYFLKVEDKDLYREDPSIMLSYVLV